MASHVSDYAGLFTGHKNSYVVHVPPFTKNGNKVTASKVYYKKFAKSKEFIPLSIEDYEAHLNGSLGLAVGCNVDDMRGAGGDFVALADRAVRAAGRRCRRDERAESEKGETECAGKPRTETG